MNSKLAYCQVRIVAESMSDYKYRIVRALSLVKSCVLMKVCRHACDITRFFIGYVLSGASFERLVGNMSVYKKKGILLHLSNYF